MRVVLIGSAVERAALRAQVEESGLEIAGEAETIGEARAGHFNADAFVVGQRNGTVAVQPEALTPRELEVLELLAQGFPNKSIAHELKISDQTVKFHVASIYGKLGAVNRTDAVRRAVRQGLVVL